MRIPLDGFTGGQSSHVPSFIYGQQTLISSLGLAKRSHESRWQLVKCYSKRRVLLK